MNQSNDILSEEDEEGDVIDSVDQYEEEEQQLRLEKNNIDEKEEEQEEVLDETESSKKYWSQQKQIDNFDFGFLDEDFYHFGQWRDNNDASYPSSLFMNSVLPTEQ
jgi:hypothetical protein